MILHRPYAFLIKHFKLIHLIITLLLGITAYQSRNIYNYINLCIENTGNKYNALNYVNYGIFIYIIIAIALMIIIRWLLKYKDKPRSIYLYSILYYIVVSIVLLMVFIYLEKIPSEQIVQKTIRVYRDIMLMILILQYIITAIMLTRGLGFDIKKFNFRKDIAELNISEEDAEEIEVNIFSSLPKLTNRLRKEKRELGYYYKEYKLIILSILIVISIIIIYNGFQLFNNKIKIYNEGDTVGTNNYLTILDSYYLIEDSKKYIIIKFNINTLRKNNILNTSIVSLKIDNTSYIPDKNICYLFKEKGNCYKKQIITKEENTYIFAYEVDSFNNNKTYINYTESFNKQFIIKLALKEY